MTDFGVIPEGFRRKTQQDILSEIEADQAASIRATLNFSLAGAHGQLNAVFSRELALAWEALETCYDGLDAEKAIGDQLIALCKLTGTVPRAATFSQVSLTVDLDNGAELLTDVHFAAVIGKPDIRWTPVADFTSDADGSHTVLFRAERTGIVSAAAGTITAISTPATGWNSATNAADAVPGRVADGDGGDWEALRLRRETELAAAGSQSARAIVADLTELAVAGDQPIQSVTVLENDTDLINVDGLSPHSIEVVLHDSPTVDNDVIAQAIWNAKSDGIQTNGSVSGDAIDVSDHAQTVRFSRPTERAIYLAFVLSVDPDSYVGDATFKEIVAERMRAARRTGEDVTQWSAEVAGDQTGVLNLSVTLDFSPSPVGTSDLTIGVRELATFDTTRITVAS